MQYYNSLIIRPISLLWKIIPYFPFKNSVTYPTLHLEHFTIFLYEVILEKGFFPPPFMFLSPHRIE